jgi:hypothetical protein
VILLDVFKNVILEIDVVPGPAHGAIHRAEGLGAIAQYRRLIARDEWSRRDGLLDREVALQQIGIFGMFLQPNEDRLTLGLAEWATRTYDGLPGDR